MTTLVCLLFLSFAAEGATHRVSPEGAQVVFKARGRPTFITIEGSGTKLTGELSLGDPMVGGEMSFDLTGISTGISLRDDHLKEKYLETSKFPLARLSFADVRVEQGSFKFKGMLQLHGASKEVTGEAEILAGKLRAEFVLKLSDFNIELPSFQGLKVADEVAVEVRAHLEKIL